MSSDSNRLHGAILKDAAMDSKEESRKMSQIYIKLYYKEPWYILTAKIKIREYVIFIEPRRFDTASIKCLIVVSDRSWSSSSSSPSAAAVAVVAAE